MSRVVVDVDGVLADFNQGFWELLSSRGAKLDPIPPEGPPVWEYFKLLGASTEEVKAAWAFIKENPAWWGSLSPYTEALELRPLLLRLFTAKWCVIMSTRPGSRKAEGITRAWLRGHFSLPAHVPVLLVENKAAAIFGLGQVTAVLDDHPGLGQNLRQLGTKGVKVYQPAWPYNSNSISHRRGGLEQMVKEVLGE